MFAELSMLLCVLLAMVEVASCSLDVKHPVYIDLSKVSPAIVDRGQKSNLFGFAITGQKSPTNGIPSILVSAPKIDTNEPGVDNAGQVFECQLKLTKPGDESVTCMPIALIIGELSETLINNE